MMQDFGVAVFSSISTITLISILVFLSRSWILARLNASIKHEYDKEILKITSQREIRVKSEIVAELFAQWIKKNGTLDYYELNRLSFQAFMWLPKELAEELSNCLAHKPGAMDIRTILIKIRSHLQEKNDGLKPKDIIVFNEPDVRSDFNPSQVTSEAVVKPKPL